MSGSTGVGQIVVPGYPSGNLVPGFYAAFDPSKANTGQVNQQTLIIGQVTAASVYTPNVPVIMSSVSAVQSASGDAGSMLALMARRYRMSDPYGTVYLLPIADAAGATATTIVVTITVTTAIAGTISAYIGGQRAQVGVNNGDTAATIATNFAAAVNAINTMPVIATVATNVVTLTAVNKGADAGALNFRLNYLGTAGGEATPAGVTVAAATTAGVTNPTLTAALANLGTMNFDFMVFPYTDTASITALDGLLSQQSGRWSLFQQIYGVGWGCYPGTLSARTTFGLSRDDQFLGMLGVQNPPNPGFEWAADYCAAGAAAIRNAPELPLQTLAMTVLPPAIPDQDTISEQQTLLADGISTYTVDSGGTVRIQRAISLYTLNASGQPDNSWRDIPKTYTLMAGVRAMISSLSSQFARKSLVVDGTNIAGGTSQVTSKIILAAAQAIYQTLCTQGLMQNPTLFIQNSQSQNQGNGTVALLLPFYLADQLFVVALDVQFSTP
jgi:phage tail sheath gpL-like